MSLILPSAWSLLHPSLWRHTNEVMWVWACEISVMALLTVFWFPLVRPWNEQSGFRCPSLHDIPFFPNSLNMFLGERHRPGFCVGWWGGLFWMHTNQMWGWTLTCCSWIVPVLFTVGTECMQITLSTRRTGCILATLYCMKDGDISPIQLQNTQYQVCVALVWRSSEMNVYSWSVTDSQHVM